MSVLLRSLRHGRGRGVRVCLPRGQVLPLCLHDRNKTALQRAKIRTLEMQASERLLFEVTVRFLVRTACDTLEKDMCPSFSVSIFLSSPLTAEPL